MADRGPVGTLRLGCALGLALGTLAGCGSTPPAGDDGGVPLPPPVELVTPDGPDGADADAVDGTTEAAVDSASTEPVPSGPPRWFPGVGSVVCMAGLSPRDPRPLLETRTIRAGGSADRHELDVEVRAEGDAAEDVARETYIVTISDDEIRVALAPDPLRRIPGPARELPREPSVGETWETPAGLCRVEAVAQDVKTFLGVRSGCVRVRVTSPTGRVTFRWFDPLLGEVRRELLDREEKILAAWALCGDAVPSVERCREILLQP